MSPVRLYLLGQPVIERDGQPIALTSGKAVALLAYLALHDVPQHRERLLGLLWAESAEEAARKNLRNTLWNIRRLLGEDMLNVGEDRLGLDSAVWLDVREFEREAAAFQSGQVAAVPALNLYRGPLLDSLNLYEAPEYEVWLAAERERLRQTYVSLLAEQIAAERSAGDWTAVASSARLALAQDILQEPVHRVLMEAHARLGDRSAALRQYDALREVLAEELGVEPLAETESLRTAIAQGELPPTSLAAPAASRPRRERPPVAGESTQTPFVGRRAEFEALEAELQAARAGHARVVLLTGELGIGKSRLWREWSAGLPPEVSLLECRCVEATTSLPFAALAELIRSGVDNLGLLGPASPVPAVWLAEAARLLPEIRQAHPNLPRPVSLPPDQERLRVFEAFCQCMKACAPLVLCVDDFHWVDQATLDWLGYLVHRGRDLPLLLVGAYRPEEAPAALVQQAAGWGREGLLRRLPLAPLPNQEASALIAGLVQDARLRETLARRVQTQSAGNPYFMIELCRAGPGDVPAALAELVRARIERLPETARQVLQVAAVVDPNFDFALLRAVSGRDEVETLDALDVLLEGAVLVEHGEAYAFAHPLVVSVVRSGLGGARRAFLNRRAAEAIETMQAGRLPPAAARLAAFYAEAGQPERAAHYAEMAADHAFSLAAPAEAVEFHRLALRLAPSPDRELGLGRALHRKGDLAEAQSVLEAAAAGLEAVGDLSGALHAQVTIWDTLLRSGRFDEVIVWAEQGLAEVEAHCDPADRAFAHQVVGAALAHANRPVAEAERHLNEAARLARIHGLPDVTARSRFLLGNTLAQRGDLAAAIGVFREVILLARAAGDEFHEILGHNNLAYHAVLLGDLGTAHESVDAGLALAEARALDVVYQWLYSTRGEVALSEAQWAEAEAWFRQGLAEAERRDNPEMIATYRANLARAARGRGDLDMALELLILARQIAPGAYLRGRIDLWLAEVHLLRGERTAATEVLGRADAARPANEQGQLEQWPARLRKDLGAPD